MRTEALTRFRSRGITWAHETYGKVSDALTSGLLYTVLFATIAWLFGTSHVMIISPIVVIFRGKRRKYFSLALIPRIIVTLLVLNILAYIATLHVILCIILNAIVPFLLVMVQASQFAPKAYFGYVMTFVFLELRPLAFDEFLVQLAVTAFAACVLGIVLLIMRWQNGASHDPEAELADSLETLATVLDRLAEGERSRDLAQEVTKLERAFDLMCFNSRSLFRRPDRAGLRYYLYATLFQRAVYLLSDTAWQQGDESDVDVSALHDIATMIRQVKDARTPEEHAVVRRCLLMLLDMVDLPEGRIRIFFRSLLHMLMIIVSGAPERRRHLSWRFEPLRDIVEGFTRGIDPDTFEFRFAMRLSVVMVTTCTISLLWGVDHAYWLPLNAFLLLMPSYEESSHRMRTRPLGTAIGCVVAYVVSHVVREPLEVYVFCMIMITLVYCCAPGSWIQAIYSTSFALMMCSLIMPETTAMALRMFFVALAVVIVVAVNRWVLPSRKDRIYQANRRQLYEINRTYWGFVLESIDRHVEIRRSADMLSDFHLVYEEAYAYAQSLDDERMREHERRYLVRLWHMFAEVEQVEYLVQSGELSDADLGVLRHIAERLHDKVVPTQTGCLAIDLINDVESIDLRYALTHYVENGQSIALL